MRVKRRAYILGLAISYYERCLRDRARKYVMRERGLSEQTIQRFRVGYAPHKKGLLAFLKKHRVKTREAVEVGLFYRRGERVRQCFRNRIIFPLIRAGRVLSLVGRELPDQERE